MSDLDRVHGHRRWRAEFWWAVETRSGWLWDRVTRGETTSCWLDWLPAWAYRHRKNAERRALGGMVPAALHTGPALVCGDCWRFRWTYRTVRVGPRGRCTGWRLITSPRRHG